MSKDVLRNGWNSNAFSDASLLPNHPFPLPSSSPLQLTTEIKRCDHVVPTHHLGNRCRPAVADPVPAKGNLHKPRRAGNLPSTAGHVELRRTSDRSSDENGTIISKVHTFHTRGWWWWWWWCVRNSELGRNQQKRRRKDMTSQILYLAMKDVSASHAI